MYNYSDKERAEIQKRIEDDRYKNKSCDLAMAYELYDMQRITLEAVGEIIDRLISIESKLG